MSSDVVVSCKGIGKAYQSYERPFERLVQELTGRVGHKEEQFHALHAVDFELRRGETVGIIGPNGSGKSTLLQIIAGTLQPSAGTVTTKGKVAALLELGAGFNSEFSGRENVFLNGSLFGLSRKVIEQRMSSIASFADIGEHFDRQVKTYSSGMYVRLAFAIAAHVDADTLVIDEALSVGDMRFGQKCMRFLRSFRERGSLLFVSHDPGAIVALCDRAVWLDCGRLRMDGSAKAVVEHYLAEQHALDRASMGFTVGGLSAPGTPSEVEVVLEEDVDHRLDLLNSSAARNLLEIFNFDLQASKVEFGAGDARITDVALRGPDGRQQSIMLGGELVQLTVDFEARRDIADPIVGFYVKDRLGQRLFGDNTYLSLRGKDLSLGTGQVARATFRFRMPRMPSGEYSVDAAVATGTQDDHTQQHWMHDALVFRSSDETMRTGLVGIPMIDIGIQMIGEK